jgi:hypothetical protein
VGHCAGQRYLQPELHLCRASLVDSVSVLMSEV